MRGAQDMTGHHAFLSCCPFFGTGVHVILVSSYMSITQASEKWNLSKRRINTLCSQNRIPRVTRIGTIWAIPVDAEKPSDARIKNGRYIGCSKKNVPTD